MKKYRKENQQVFGIRPNHIGWEYSIITGNYVITPKDREEQMKRQRRH